MPEKVTTQNMLRNHNKVNANDMSNTEEVVRRQLEPSLPGLPANELKLDFEDEDPFGGNINNRRVAERIANEKGRVYLNHSAPSHLGDPSKARADIAKSKALNPDPVATDPDRLPPVVIPPMAPTAGSPAAKQAEELAKGNKQDGPQTVEVPAPGTQAAGTPNGPPPAWKPNAGR